MRTTRTIIVNAYAALILAILVLGPLVFMHGYRSWLVDLFYATAAVGTIAGIISRYRMAWRNGKS